jgi:hypothetical protein
MQQGQRLRVQPRRPFGDLVRQWRFRRSVSRNNNCLRKSETHATVNRAMIHTDRQSASHEGARGTPLGGRSHIVHQYRVDVVVDHRDVFSAPRRRLRRRTSAPACRGSVEAPSPLTPLTDERRQLGLTRSSLSGESHATKGMDSIHALLVFAPRDTREGASRRHPIGAPSRARRDDFRSCAGLVASSRRVISERCRLQ